MHKYPAPYLFHVQEMNRINPALITKTLAPHAPVQKNKQKPPKLCSKWICTFSPFNAMAHQSLIFTASTPKAAVLTASRHWSEMIKKTMAWILKKSIQVSIAHFAPGCAQGRDMSWPQHRKYANLIICMVHSVLSIFIQNKSSFASKLNSSKHSQVCLCFTSEWRAQKWDVFILLPHKLYWYWVLDINMGCTRGWWSNINF